MATSLIGRIFGTGNSAPSMPPSAAQQANMPNQQPVQQQPSNNPAANQPTMQTQQTAQTSPNGVVPTQQAEVSPLDQFKDIWQPTVVDPNAAPQDVQLTQQHFLEAAGKVDFTKVLAPDTLAKITAGGEGATQAFLEALNKTSQTVFGQSLAASQKLVERAVGKAREEFATKVPATIKGQNVRENLLAKNPQLANPAVAPVVDALRQQLQEKFPNATETELQQQAENYILSLGSVFAPAPAPKAPSVPSEQDWSDL